MWKWDQGRLDYFQFDELRKIARFSAQQDLRQADHNELTSATGLPFSPDNPKYKPWRNYSRTFQQTMIVVPYRTNASKLTEIGQLLADDGKITSDEYFHFLAQATTDPSPALGRNAWKNRVQHRYPLLFALRFILARASQGDTTTDIEQVIGAYQASGFRGDEDQTAFLSIIANDYPSTIDTRQPSESIKVLAQISYLSATKNQVTVSLASEDADNLFDDLKPVGGTRLADPVEEILRISALFPSATAELKFEYPATIITDAEEAGFSEGGRVKRTHLTLERNGKIRRAFFSENPSPICNFCDMDTRAKYPWTTSVLDVHHLLPLCSGARTSLQGTVLEDLVANCPTCHRAVHRYYDVWLQKEGQSDFADADETRLVYNQAKERHQRMAPAHA